MGVRLIIVWLGNCLSLLVAAAVIPSIGYGHNLRTLLLAGLIFGVVNFALRPIVILMTLPAVILSLGFALLFINALMLWLTSKLVTGLHVGGFWSTVGGAFVIWIVNLAMRPWIHRRPSAGDQPGPGGWWGSRGWSGSGGWSGPGGWPGRGGWPGSGGRLRRGRPRDSGRRG